MNKQSFKHQLSGLMAMLGLLASSAANAIPITLPTTNLNANSVMALSADGFYGMAAAGVSMSALGNARQVAGITFDGEVLPAFNLPITEVTVNVGIFPPIITPIQGEAIGSALLVKKGSNSLSLANFQIDYKTEKVLADFIAGGVTTKAMAIYDFDVVNNLNISLNGLTLNMHQQLNHMMLTTEAQQSFTSALKLNKAVASALSGIDFGTITIDINGSLRTGLSNTPFTSSMIPEPQSVSLMFLGLMGLAMVSRRKMRT